MAGYHIRRRELLAVGGVVGAGLATWPALKALELPASSTRQAVPDGLITAFTQADRHFYDSRVRAIRPTNGGGPHTRTGLVDYTIFNPALWQRESYANVIYNQWQLTNDDALRQRLLLDWAAVRSLYTAGQMIGMSGGSPAFRIVTTFDDACWLCSYLMHAHMAGAQEALGFLVEAIAYNLNRFADPDTKQNPTLTLSATTPNLPRINLSTGRESSSEYDKSGQNVITSRYGSLYTLPDSGNYSGGYGKCSSAFEAHMGLAALYAFQRLRLPWLQAYAVQAQDFVRTCLMTPDPLAPAADPDHTPSKPEERKAQYLVETEFCLSTAVPSNDPYSVAFQPRNRWYGKPVRSLDSTYLGGALAYTVLSARLHRTGLGDSLRLDAIRTAKAIISQQAYGRVVNGRSVIANTRDPHSEGHWALPFVREVLTLPGCSKDVSQAFTNTGRYIIAHCRTPDGYMTADWAGPERNPVTGRTTWEQDYAANPGAQAGHAQIMTTAETLAMLQACNPARH